MEKTKPIDMEYQPPSRMPNKITPAVIYLHGWEIPADFEVVEFRPPKKNDTFLAQSHATEVATKTNVCFEDGLFSYYDPRFILKKKAKRLKVIRVLEYEGPEDWIKTTMDNNAVNSKRTILSIGRNFTIKEISFYQSEVPNETSNS